jgi:hypothetical protein
MKVLNVSVRKVLLSLLALTLVLTMVGGLPLTKAQAADGIILGPDQYRWSQSTLPSGDPAGNITLYWEVHFVNLGTETVYNVTATIISVPENVIIENGDVAFDDPIPAGLGDWSDDDFGLTFDMTDPQDPMSMMYWRIEYDDAEGNHYIIFRVGKFYWENGLEGLTPGFWKNHWEAPRDYWPAGYEPNDPDQTFLDVFGVGPDNTLLHVLKTGGGKDKALGRHAVAALLNAAHPNINYFFSEAEVIQMVQDAYASGDYEDVKDILEAENELEGDILE